MIAQWLLPIIGLANVLFGLAYLIVIVQRRLTTDHDYWLLGGSLGWVIGWSIMTSGAWVCLLVPGLRPASAAMIQMVTAGIGVIFVPATPIFARGFRAWGRRRLVGPADYEESAEENAVQTDEVRD
jgi:hypothetical protein